MHRLALALWLVLGCEGAASSLDASTMRPDRPPIPRTEAGPPTGGWVNATGNLAGMPSECGNLSSISSKPNEDMILAGVALHGIWASRDGGATWTALGNGGGSANITNRPNAFVFDPANPNVFWEAGIYNATGVFRTDDNGVTFEGLGDVTHNDSVSVDFTDPQRRTLLAGSHERTQTVGRSTDGGDTWINVGANLPAGTNHSTGVYVVDATTHLVGCSGYEPGTTSGIFRTTDGGEHWAMVSSAGGSAVPLAHSDGALYWPSPGGGLVRSTDGGANWSDPLGAGQIGNLAPIELPDGRLAMLGNGGVLVSDDLGGTWRVVTTPPPFNPNSMTYSRFRKAFFVSHFSCNPEINVPADAVMRYDFDFETE